MSLRDLVAASLCEASMLPANLASYHVAHRATATALFALRFAIRRRALKWA